MGPPSGDEPAEAPPGPQPGTAQADESVQDEAEPGPDLEIGVAARVVVRPEFRSNTLLNQASDDDLWRVRQAARLAVSAQYGPVKAVVMLQDARDWGDETTTFSTDPFTGIHQGYVEVSGESRAGDVSGFLRAGRQEFLFWNKRMIGNSPWQPALRAFDAFRGRADLGIFSVDVGASLLDAPSTFSVVDELGETTTARGSGDQLYWGDLGAAFHRAFELNLAVVVLQQGRTPDSPNRSRNFTMPAAWIHGTPVDGLTYELEVDVQLGEDGTREHRAWSGFASLQYKIPVPTSPTLRASYEITTGSRCENEVGLGPCGEAQVRDFDQLYGNRHGYRGFLDLIGFVNVRDLHLRFAMRPQRMVSLLLDFHYFQLHEAKGAWSDTGGRLVGRGWDIDNDDHGLGHEIDILADIRPFPSHPDFGVDGPLRIRPGYGLFIPVGGGASIGGTTPQHFAYLWLIVELGHRFTIRPRRGPQ